MYTTKSILKKVYVKRGIWSHKCNFGKLLVITGSEVHTGSPTFVGLSAYRAGCDLVFLIGPERAMNIAASYSPVLITKPLSGKQLEDRHIDEIVSATKDMDAVVIGPGLWRTKETRKAIIELAEKIYLPMVIDADAVRAISAKKEILKDKRCVLTPHADEFKELTNVKVFINLKERMETVKKEARYLKTVILLKGHIDVISDGKQVVLNKTGSPYLTKGGCGDTLAGICGALLARNIEPFIAAQAAAFINGKAGEIAAKKYKEGLLPTDLIEQIPFVIK